MSEALKRISFIAASHHLSRRRKRTQGFGYGFWHLCLSLPKLQLLYRRVSEKRLMYLDLLSGVLLNVVEVETYPFVTACCSRVRKLHLVLCFKRETKLGGLEFQAENQISYLQGRTDSDRSCLGAQLALNPMHGLSDICCRPSSYESRLHHLKASWTWSLLRKRHFTLLECILQVLDLSFVSIVARNSLRRFLRCPVSVDRRSRMNLSLPCVRSGYSASNPRIIDVFLINGCPDCLLQLLNLSITSLKE